MTHRDIHSLGEGENMPGPNQHNERSSIHEQIQQMQPNLRTGEHCLNPKQEEQTGA